jgi:hypothetical protein
MRCGLGTSSNVPCRQPHIGANLGAAARPRLLATRARVGADGGRTAACAAL